ncbi:MAG: hypothetical protein ACRC7N_12250 [Clostridium sp.]
MFNNFFKGIYDRVKKKVVKRKKRKNSSVIAFLALKKWELPKKEEMISFFKVNFSETIYINNWKEDIGIFDLKNYQVIITLMPNQIPFEDLDICNYDIYGSEIIEGHKAYLIISINGGYHNEEINKSLLLSRVIAGIIEQRNVKGIYWHNSKKIRSSEDFYTKFIKSKNDNVRLPYELWFDIKLKINSDFTQDVRTIGMREMGHYDIKIKSTKIDSYIIYLLIHELSCNILIDDIRLNEGELIIINKIKLMVKYVVDDNEYINLNLIEV